jgi:hypothetical protein
LLIFSLLSFSIHLISLGLKRQVQRGRDIIEFAFYAFQGTTNLLSITLGNGVTSIGADAFNGLRQLKYVAIGNNVKSIEERAFINCSSIETIILPASVTSIGSEAFRFCTSLTSVTYNGVISEDNFSRFFSFPGDLRQKYFIHGIGTYTTENPGNLAIWAFQN